MGTGGAKLPGAAVMLELLAKVGLGQWFQYFTGLLDVAAGIGLLISRSAFNAAVLLAIVMAGAFIARVTVRGSSCRPGRAVHPHRADRLLAKGLNINQQRTKT